MVEYTACLSRSYCLPSSSSPEQGDPFRCLTSSISFGIYMSESLDWQKWSTFTENRHMEDVKKYSRPGSVAQMKAHFEAHYKKKAAERAAALLEQHNEVYRCNVDQDSMQTDNQTAKGKTREEEATSNMVSDPVELSRCTPHSGEGRAPESARLLEAEEIQMVDPVGFSNCLEKIEDVQTSGCNQTIDERQDLAQLVEVENQPTSDQVDVRDQFISIEDNDKGVYGEDGKTERKATGKLEDPASLDKTIPIFSPFKTRGRNGVPKPPAPPKPSVPIKKRQYKIVNSVSRESSEPIQKKQYRKANSGSKGNEADVSNRKTVIRSLHISIDLAPKVTKKQLSPTLQRLANSRLVKTLAGKTPQATQGKPLRDNIGLPAHPAVSLLQKKFSSKTPSICTRNVQSTTVPCPFNFKSDKRAVKHKERTEQNAKAKETEKAKLQENLKAIAAVPCSPFASGDTVKDNNSPQPRRRLIASCIEVRGKNNQSPAYPLKSVSKKSISENASPNIQL